MVLTVARGAVALFTLLQAGLTVAVPSAGLGGFGVFGDKPLVVKRTGGGTGTGSNACQALAQAGLGGLLYFATDSEYNTTITGYYAADVQDVKPTCILKPLTAAHVSKAVKVLNSGQGKTQGWTMAVKSGGHAPYASNNVQNGVTIDLARLNSVTFESCKHNSKYGFASIGAGARWGDVYAALEPQGVMVGGGREGHVGVAGFLLGGGFSWYSAKRGMALDNIASYEVVLADGRIVTATGTKNSDLFKALKGGLNNFGIVTKFEMKTFPASLLYGGVMAFPWTSAQQILTKFVAMIENNRANPAETGFVSLSWSPGYPAPSVAWITANTDGVTNSTSFIGLENLSPVVDYRFTMPLTSLTQQLAGTTGLYNTWYTTTIHNTVYLVTKYMTIFQNLVTDLSTNYNIDEPISLIFVLTPLPKTYAEHNPTGNVLGLEKTLTRNSIVLQPEVILPTKKFQVLIQAKLRQAVQDMETYAKQKGGYNPYLYINYANPEQANPIGRYGAENVAFLKKASKKYDPQGFWQSSRVAGAFKLGGL
ncbi:putative FAD-linked oxidoreductase [Naviculisporaceae sp. PSN 640]